MRRHSCGAASIACCGITRPDMRWLLRRFLSDEERRTVESELAELYEIRRREVGDRAAARWLRRQRAIYPLHLLRDRLRLRDDSAAQGGTLMSGLWRDLM